MDWKQLLKLKIPHRQYLRPLPPSRREKFIGFIILLLVAGIGAAIYVSGRHYDPNLFRLDPKLLNRTAQDSAEGVRVVGGERRSTRETEPVGKIDNPNSNIGTATPISKPKSTSLIPEDAAGNGWERRGEEERFTSENLYDKVDGRENLYKSYQFHELLTADFIAKGKENRFIQVELFDMTNAKSALGIFTAERPSNSSSAKIGREGYIDSNGAFFWKGKFYVRVIGSDSEKSTQKTAIEIARAVSEKLPESKENEAVIDPLPTEGRIPNSFTLIPESAFGQSFFRNVYSARYKVGNLELTGFVMITESPDKASAIIDEYRKAMASFGNLTQEGSDGIYHIEAVGSHYLIFARGKAVGGVMEADEKEPAIKLAKRIAEYIRK